MSQNSEEKHKDCEWLIQEGKDSYICCDVRRLMRGKKLNGDDALKEGCQFFHKKQNKNKNK